LSLRGEAMTAVSEGGESLGMDTEEESSHTTEHREERDDLINPYWIEDKDFERGEVDYLSGPEIQFWKDLIDKYLFPIDKDDVKQAQITAGLKELRDKSVFFFAMFNALFVLIVFMLTLNKDILHIDWPFGVKTNITITEDARVLVSKEYLHLEPIGIVLVFFFFSIIVIQFVAMLFHRFGTISHILASTELNFFCSKKEDIQSDQDLIEKNAVEIVKQMQRLKGIDGDYDSDSAASNRLAHRRTIQNLERTRQNKKRAIGTLDVAFKKRFFALSGEDEAPLMDGQKQNSQTPILGAKLPMRRETLKAIEVARDQLITNLHNERKGSKMQTLGASNPHNNNKEKHRNNTRITGDTIDQVFQPNGGIENPAFDVPSSNTDDESSTTRNSTATRLRHIPWKDRNVSSSDQGNTSSATSKM